MWIVIVFGEKKKKGKTRSGRHCGNFIFFLGEGEKILRAVRKLPRPFAAKQLEWQWHIRVPSLSLLTLLLYSERAMGM